MNKKLLITILTILGLTVIVGSFWYFPKLQKTNTNLTQNNTAKNISNNQNQKQEQSQEQKNDSQNQVNNKNSQEKQDNQNKQINTKQLSPEEIEKLKKEKDLVWYEIPELNIKFLVKKEIANKIGYRDFYVESFKVNGKKLYIVDYYKKHYYDTGGNLDSFAELLAYKLDDSGRYLKNGPHNTTKWQEICPNNILFKNKQEIICYNDDSFTIEMNKRNGNYEIFDSITKKLFDGYLKTVPIQPIK